MAEQQQGLSSAQTRAILDYITERNIGRRQLTAEGMAGVGTAMTQGQLPAEDESLGKERIKLGLTEVLANLDKYEQLKDTEKSRHDRETRRHEANVLRSAVMLALGEGEMRADLKGSTIPPQINQAGTLMEVAMQRREAEGYRYSKLLVPATQSKVGELSQYTQYDRTTGGHVMSSNRDTQSEMFLTMYEHLKDIPDARERAAYIDQAQQRYNYDLWDPMNRFVSVKGASEGMGGLVREAEAAKEAALAVDDREQNVIDRQQDVLLRQYGNYLDPTYRDLLSGLFDAAQKPREEERAVGTRQPPPPEDASYEDKNQWVKDFSYGEALLDPNTMTIQLTNPRPEQEGEVSVSYTDFIKNTPVQQERPYAEQTRDYIEELWGDLEAGDRPDLRKLRREFMDTAMFKAYKKSRGYPDNPATDPIALRAMIREGRATRRVMKQAGRAISRQNILGGQTISTPGQYRRAALTAALAGPPESVAAPGRTPLQKIGMALAAPVALPAALLAGGAREVSKMLKKKGSESSEAEPEGPAEDPLSLQRSRFREMLDEGTINQEQFDEITSALTRMEDQEEITRSPARRADAAEDAIEKGEVEPGTVLVDDDNIFSWVGEGGYVWSVKKDGAGEPTGDATILKAPEGKEDSEGTTVEMFPELQTEMDKFEGQRAEETAVEEGRRMEEQKPDLIHGEMELAEETREERGQRYEEMGVERQPLGEPVAEQRFIATTRSRTRAVKTYIDVAKSLGLIDDAQADVIRQHFLAEAPDEPIEELHKGMIAGAQKKFEDTLSPEERAQGKKGELTVALETLRHTQDMLQKGVVTGEKGAEAIPFHEVERAAPTEEQWKIRERELELAKGARQKAVLEELSGEGLGKEAGKLLQKEQRLESLKSRREELLDIEKPEDMSTLDWAILKAQGRQAGREIKGQERRIKRTGKRIEKKREKKKEATQGGA